MRIFLVTSGTKGWIRVSMGERRKRQIQSICRQWGLRAVRIVRNRIGTLRLGNSKPRQLRHLTTKEVEALKQPIK